MGKGKKRKRILQTTKKILQTTSHFNKKNHILMVFCINNRDKKRQKTPTFFPGSSVRLRESNMNNITIDPGEKAEIRTRN